MPDEVASPNILCDTTSNNLIGPLESATPTGPTMISQMNSHCQIPSVRLLPSYRSKPQHQWLSWLASQFRLSMHQNTDIKKQLSISRRQQADENRKRIAPIIKTIIFCGRQNIPLWGVTGIFANEAFRQLSVRQRLGSIRQRSYVTS